MNIKATSKIRNEIAERFRVFEGSPKERRALVGVMSEKHGISYQLVYRILRESGVAAEWAQKRSGVPLAATGRKAPPSLSALVTAARKATISLADHSRVLDARVRNHTALLADLRSC